MISLTEASFVKKALLQQQRLDGRSLNQTRDLNFEFENDRGRVIVHIGRTKYQDFNNVCDLLLLGFLRV